MSDELKKKYIELVDRCNNSKTRAEHFECMERVNGFLDGVSACGGNEWNLLISADVVQMSRGVNRPMCGGVWLDWEPQEDIDNPDDTEGGE